MRPDDEERSLPLREPLAGEGHPPMTSGWRHSQLQPHVHDVTSETFSVLLFEFSLILNQRELVFKDPPPPQPGCDEAVCDLQAVPASSAPQW